MRRSSITLLSTLISFLDCGIENHPEKLDESFYAKKYIKKRRKKIIF